ncbi:MAG: LTA synthase family protein [Chitinophagaceae bacterium]|nr:LTA synthase family protein [Chitinophagaceae bacterium]
MTLFRLIFFFHYRPAGYLFSAKVFLLGLRYDLRIIGIVGIIILFGSSIARLNPFKYSNAKKIWNFLLPLFFIILLFFYVIDFYHYDYLHQRLNASVLNYAADAGISFNMMWQTYPLLKILILFILLLFAVRIFFGWLLLRQQQLYVTDKRKFFLLYIISFLLLGAAVFGRIGQYPLRWSDAFTLNDDFKSNVALNPFQSFFSTLSFRNSTYDIKKIKSGYLLMANYLGVKNLDSVQLNFKRNYIIPDTIASKPNVVLVICESFSAYKSSMYGNPLNTTPYFNELSKKGLFFDRCFTPAYGTARGVWAIITGIPDVESPRTASRNPNAVDQHTIINDFKGYNNFYFLGGSATWANIRGLLTNNIKSLHLYEQEDYESPKVDVWGVSDKNLFLESNAILAKQQSPFFAIIQTADNHRPYTIPKEDEAEFKKIIIPADSLKKYGFENNDEFNAFRYTDFCYQKFMEAAAREKYFDNTIFVFVGDHGIRGNAGNMFPKIWTENGLTAEHVPLLFYAPKIIQPGRVGEICSQVDILPTIASLTGASYTNNTFGRNLADTSVAGKQKFAFIIDHDVKTIGLIDNEYYYLKNIKSGKEELLSVISSGSVPGNEVINTKKKYLRTLTEAYYETAKYLLLNNKKKH